ncbi:50S ribosomal protein L18 [Sinorhizobium meliloti]|nr:50S ribosomal protein L18 [Sinorhizobium meliloti]
MASRKDTLCVAPAACAVNQGGCQWPPALSFIAPSKNIYAQIITMLPARRLPRHRPSNGSAVFAERPARYRSRTAVGKLLAERASKAGIRTLSLIVAPSSTHGRIKALAEAAREGGLNF